MTKVAITGGSGFLGANLTNYLHKTEPDTEVVLVDLAVPPIELKKNNRFVYADIRNLKSLLSAFEGVDEVYHLAGILGTSELIPIASLACDINISGSCNVFDACVQTGVKRVYNVAKPYFKGYEENAYTLTKHTNELLGLLYRKKFGLEVATVRWLNAYGNYQHLYPVRKLIPTMILFALYGVDLEIYGSGNQTIDPIHAIDMARFTVYACRHLGKHPAIVDLGSGEAVTVNDAAGVIKEEVNNYLFSIRKPHTKSKIVHIPMRAGEEDDINLKANMEFWDSIGMKPEYSFKESIRDVVKYVDELPEYYKRSALHFYQKL